METKTNGRQSFLALAAMCVILIASNGCRAPQPVTGPVEKPTTYAFPPEAWACAWQGDAADVNLKPHTDGSLTILLEGGAENTGKGATVGASAPGWRLTPQSIVHFRLSVSKPVRVAFAVRTDQFYESPSQELMPGEVHELTLDLGRADFKSARTGWEHRDRVTVETPLQTVELVLYPVPNQTRKLTLHSATLANAEGPLPHTRVRAETLELRDCRQNATEVAVYEKQALIAELTPAYANPFDHADVTADAILHAPDGRTLVCPAFAYKLADTSKETDTWKVRFTPDVPGRWIWQLQVVTPTATVQSEPLAFECTDSERDGFIRVAKDNPHMFEYHSGRFYYPIGHNVCWNSLEEYAAQFMKMGQHGENWSRIWIAPWNCDIEWSPRGGAFEGLGWYNLDNAEKLDRIIELAEQNGLYLQLVLHEHCRVSAKTNPEWHNNPYNAALGGPCRTPADFFTNEEARQLTKNRLRYLVARYGYSTYVMAWELFNEVNLGDDISASADTAWHREMGQYIRSIDPHGHMITTSYAGGPNADTLRLPEIDFSQSHVYLPNVVSYFVRLSEPYRSLNQPYFIGEFGRHTDDGVDARDKAGQVMHAGIWSQFMLPAGGNAMSWWWYDHIEPNNLYFHFDVLSRFAEGIDRRAPASLQTGRIIQEDGTPLNVIANRSAGRIMAWIYDPDILPWKDIVTDQRTGREVTLQAEDLEEGAWILETWNTWTGTSVTQHLDVVNGQASFTVREAGPDFAVKLYRAAGTEADMAPRLVLDTWDPTAQYKVQPTRLTIPRLEYGIQIDGSLEEWDNVPETRFGEAPDGAVSFRVGHADGSLYVAIDVADESIVRQQDVGPKLWQDDCVEVWLDTLDNADFFNNMPHNPGCYQFNIAPAANRKPTAHVTYRHPQWNDRTMPGVDAASSLTANGYCIEARFPLSELRGDKQPDDPSQIGINISLCDADAGEEWAHTLWQGTEEWDARQWASGRME